MDCQDRKRLEGEIGIYLQIKYVCRILRGVFGVGLGADVWWQAGREADWVGENNRILGETLKCQERGTTAN